jgi:hypothetical protein
VTSSKPRSAKTLQAISAICARTVSRVSERKSGTCADVSLEVSPAAFTLQFYAGFGAYIDSVPLVRLKFTG